MIETVLKLADLDLRDLERCQASLANTKDDRCSARAESNNDNNKYACLDVNNSSLVVCITVRLLHLHLRPLRIRLHRCISVCLRSIRLFARHRVQHAPQTPTHLPRHRLPILLQQPFKLMLMRRDVRLLLFILPLRLKAFLLEVCQRDRRARGL
jgi:hypothetical protein